MNIFDRTYQGFIQFRRYRRTWAFPEEIERLLIDETVGNGKKTLHLYGGLARFGVRLDVDPTVNPDVVGNAWWPPFRCKSFDVVILDPPYTDLRAGFGLQILAPAACLSRDRIWWFHTHWSVDHAFGLHLCRWWACSPCSLGAPMRILAEYQVDGHPRYCHAIPRKGRRGLAKILGRYDWSRLTPKSRPTERPMIQARLL